MALCLMRPPSFSNSPDVIVGVSTVILGKAEK
jgi:hypothetical protein